MPDQFSNSGTTQTYIGRVPGLLRLGVIVDFDEETLAVKVYIGNLKEYSAQNDVNNTVSTQLPVSYFAISEKDDFTSFVGGYPENGTPVVVSQADGGQWFIVQILARDPAALNTIIPALPNLERRSYLIQYDNTFIKLSQREGIVLGEDTNSLTLDTSRNIISDDFDTRYTFTEASRTIEGIIKRDTRPNENYASSLRETALSYDDTLKIIPLDPVAKENWSNTGSSARNPSRAEKREVIYEFGRSFNVLNDEQEFVSYKDSTNINIGESLNRRHSRADALSLSLVAPNYLMETIKGTVVDVYGNILDINRSIIPLGKVEKLSIQKIKTNLQEQDPLGNVFENIKTLERREIAYHFELNAKKDLIGPPDVNDRSNYARERSRFSLDIDKEGLIKLNVPASSKTGNIPLLTRYENYSTVSPNEKTKDPNDLVFNDNAQDILIESFIGDNGVVKIIDELNGNAAPMDRFSSEDSPTYLKHGTAYHNIANTLSAFSNSMKVYERIPTTFMGRNLVIPKSNIVSQEVKISGDQANGGGRSASLNFDGSVDLNIGANTINRHSLWADFQGAIIANVGRDCTANNISAGLHFDGELLIQSGGSTSNKDTRFIDLKLEDGTTLNNGNKSGAIDLRIINSSGSVNVIRIDNTGINIHSESRINIYSNGDIDMTSTGRINLNGEDVIINRRKVRRDPGLGSI